MMQRFKDPPRATLGSVGKDKDKRASRDRSKWATQALGSVSLVVLGMVFQFAWDQSAMEAAAPSYAAALDATFKDMNAASPKQVIMKDGQEDGWKDISVFYGSADHIGRRGDKAQADQDRMVSGLLRQVRNGFFIDLAANDATSLSNTYKLETDYDWTGLCFEPNPTYWRRLSYRKCKVVAAVVGAERMQEVQFITHDGTPRTPSGGIIGDQFDNKPGKPRTSSKPTKYYTVPLMEALERFHAPSVIDYFSLDVEGAEHYVMKDFPFDSYTFKIMTVERPKQALVDLLYEKGYVYMGANNKWGMETLFLHKSMLVEGKLELSTISELHWITGDTKYIKMGKDKFTTPTVTPF